MHQAGKRQDFRTRHQRRGPHDSLRQALGLPQPQKGYFLCPSQEHRRLQGEQRLTAQTLLWAHIGLCFKKPRSGSHRLFLPTETGLFTQAAHPRWSDYSAVSSPPCLGTLNCHHFLLFEGSEKEPGKPSREKAKGEEGTDDQPLVFCPRLEMPPGFLICCFGPGPQQLHFVDSCLSQRSYTPELT